MAVALIAIGPKDLPVAIRTVTAMIKKARGMAAEFQGHVDEMMRDANLSDVKDEINRLRRFDFKGAAEHAIDPDGTLRSTMAQSFEVSNGAAETPVMTHPAMPVTDSAGFVGPTYVPPPVVEEPVPDAPAFIPPEAARKPRMPDFIPPGTKRWGY